MDLVLSSINNVGLLSIKRINPHRATTCQMKAPFTDSSRLPIQMQTFLLKDVPQASSLSSCTCLCLGSHKDEAE